MNVKCDKLADIADVIDSLHKTPKYSDEGQAMVRCTDVKYGKLDLTNTFKVNEEVFAEFSRRYTPSKEDIIITRVGSYGITAIVDELNFCLGQNTSVIVPKNINPRYLYLALNSPCVKNQIEFSVVGSTQKTLSLKAINNLDIPRFSPIREKKIAKIGGELDDKIQLNRQINQTLESMAQAIFQSWFVDFDPVKAKITALEQWQILTDDQRTEWLNELLDTQDYFKTCLLELTAKAGLSDDENLRLDSSLDLISCRGHGPESSENLDIGLNTLRKKWQSKIAGPALQSASETLYLNIAAMTAISSRDETSLADMPTDEFAQLYKTASLFPKRLVDSELGEIPEGWRVGCIGEIAKAKGGYAFKGSSFSSDGNPVVKIKNITGDGRVDINGAVCIDDDLANSSNRFKLCDGDLLMAMTGATVGKIGFVITEGKSVYLNQRVAKFESDRFGRKISQFLFCCFERESILSLVVGAAQGSAQPNISSSGIESVSLILPFDELIDIFCEKTNFIFKEWINNLSGNSILEEIRDVVLPKLLSGELAITNKVENLGGLFDRL